MKPSEAVLTPVTRLVLLLFLEDPQRRWTAGGMTTRLACSTDAIRNVHSRLKAAGWTHQTWDHSPGRNRRLVWLSPAGAKRAREVLREALAPEDLALAAEADLAVVAAALLSGAVLPVPSGESGDRT